MKTTLVGLDDARGAPSSGLERADEAICAVLRQWTTWWDLGAAGWARELCGPFQLHCSHAHAVTQLGLTSAGFLSVCQHLMITGADPFAGGHAHAQTLPPSLLVCCSHHHPSHPLQLWEGEEMVISIIAVASSATKTYLH